MNSTYWPDIARYFTLIKAHLTSISRLFHFYLFLQVTPEEPHLTLQTYTQGQTYSASLHHHCTITAPSLYRHCNITTPSLHHHYRRILRRAKPVDRRKAESHSARHEPGDHGDDSLEAFLSSPSTSYRPSPGWDESIQPGNNSTRTHPPTDISTLL